MASKKETQDSVVVAAAKVIGSTAGKIASLVGATGEGSKPAKGKLPKTNKARLPRREKKAKQKLATTKSAK